MVEGGEVEGWGVGDGRKGRGGVRAKVRFH